MSTKLRTCCKKRIKTARAVSGRLFLYVRLFSIGLAFFSARHVFELTLYLIDSLFDNAVLLDGLAVLVEDLHLFDLDDVIVGLWLFGYARVCGAL